MPRAFSHFGAVCIFVLGVNSPRMDGPPGTLESLQTRTLRPDPKKLHVSAKWGERVRLGSNGSKAFDTSQVCS
jgi:hypothetical protein